jgi:hypothetical protein
MAKVKNGSANLTNELPGLSRGRGRPKVANPLTLTQRQAKHRAKCKAEGVCSCCGQSLPSKTNPPPQKQVN